MICHLTQVACALLIFGEKLEDHVDVKNILVEMGIYFQVQDDYLDCYGDPEFIGKVRWETYCLQLSCTYIGTDIEDSKCTWLVVKALEFCNDEQKKVLYENYGKDDLACVAKVKELYNVIDIQVSFCLLFDSTNLCFFS
ncbi:Farnesyl pyrophosphate synthase 2 [Bienertia sinuspersici]